MKYLSKNSLQKSSIIFSLGFFLAVLVILAAHFQTPFFSPKVFLVISVIFLFIAFIYTSLYPRRNERILVQVSNFCLPILFVIFTFFNLSTTTIFGPIIQSYVHFDSLYFFIGALLSFTLFIIYKGNKTQYSEDSNDQIVVIDENREKIFTWIGLILVVVVTFSIKVTHLGTLGYSTDEGSTALYAHYINASGLSCGDDICYTRGFPYLYLVSMFTKIFGVTEFWVRFPGLIIFTCIIPASYIFVRTLGYPRVTGIIAAILIATADWGVMLARYARMYPLLSLLILLSLIFFIKVFYEKKNKFFLVLIVTSGLAVATHQFGMLLCLLLVVPLLSGNFLLYRDKFFVLYGISIILINIYFFLFLKGTLYLDPNYISIYDIDTTRIATDKYWYLANFHWPIWTYLSNFIHSLPGIAVLSFSTFGLFKFNKQEWIQNILPTFIIGSFLIIAVYKIDYVPKYLWWFLPFIYISISIFFGRIFELKKNIAVFFILVVVVCSLVNTYAILTRKYGDDQSSLPLLMTTHVEQYIIDDKTTVDYVIARKQEGDIIVTDYWVQDVYLELKINKQSEYRINRWDIDYYLAKYPYYKIYKTGDIYKVSEHGPKLITTLNEIPFTSGKIWYISSTDFVGRKYEYISNYVVDEWLKEHNVSPVYIGKDGNSKVYILPSEVTMAR